MYKLDFGNSMEEIEDIKLNKKLKVATVFSGIGAIEHALKRMEIEHEIVFACDNGDVDILSKKIKTNTVAELKEEIELLGKENINIATMNVGRRENSAIMLLTVDSEVGRRALKVLRELSQIKWAHYLDLTI